MNKFRDETIKHFDQKFLKNSQGEELPTLWPNKEYELLRFRILAEIDDLNKKTVLDVGCGFGNLYYFLKESGVRLKDYVGIDLNPSVIEKARKARPELKLFHVDILENDYKPNQFDYSLASGLFNVELADWEERTRLILDELFRISRLGIAVNFLKWRADNRNPASHYVKISDMLGLTESYTKRYVIRCDYKDNDFTIYLYK
jgi:SAM-dependent methyltransferase